MIPALSAVQRRVAIGCGIALVVGSSAALPGIALSQIAPNVAATPDPSALTEYRPEPLPLRDYARVADPFRADIVDIPAAATRPIVAVQSHPVETPKHVSSAGPGVVPDLTGGAASTIAAIDPRFDRQDYGVVRALGTNFALLERGGSMPIVRVGDVLGNTRIVKISDAGVELANGLLLRLDTSVRATPAPVTASGDRAGASPSPAPASTPQAAPTPNASAATAPPAPVQQLVPRVPPTDPRGGDQS